VAHEHVEMATRRAEPEDALFLFLGEQLHHLLDQFVPSVPRPVLGLPDLLSQRPKTLDCFFHVLPGQHAIQDGPEGIGDGWLQSGFLFPLALYVYKSLDLFAGESDGTQKRRKFEILLHGCHENGRAFSRWWHPILGRQRNSEQGGGEEKGSD
jgi:hypothetical protein